MSISVVIPTFDRARQVVVAVQSVLAQSLLPLEIIVVDDGSHDDTLDALRRLPVSVLSQSNKGVSEARNEGVRAASGEWIAFLDSDDLWYPNKLQRQWAFHQEHPHLLISHTDETWVRNGTEVPKNKHQKKWGGWIYPQALKLCFISPSTTLIQRDFFLACGGFDKDLKAAEDYDLWLRISSQHEVGYLDEALTIKNGGHPDQLSLQRGLDRFRVLALEKILKTPLSPQHQEISIETLIKKYQILAKGCQKYGHIKEAEHCHQRFEHWRKTLQDSVFPSQQKPQFQSR